MSLWFADNTMLENRARNLWRYGGQKCYVITQLLGIAMDYGRRHKKLLHFFVSQHNLNGRALEIAKAMLKAGTEVPNCVNL